MYFAVIGTQLDGHDFIGSAIDMGASVIVCERAPEKYHDDITYLQVEDSQKVVGIIASNFYDNPARKMKIIGVTGTNGKTTIATLLYQTLKHLGENVGLLSTVENIIGVNVSSAAHTTSDPITLQKNLAEMHDLDCDYVCMEVSSHAIHQDRILGIDYDIAIFTNLSQEHLDYHKTMEEYARAKKMLFDNLNKNSIAIINQDDEWSEFIASDTVSRVVYYCSHLTAENSFEIIEKKSTSTDVRFGGNALTIPMIGRFNVYNFLAVYTTLFELGFRTEDIINALENSRGPRGRMETIKNAGVSAIIDYSHTPDALENVLKTITENNKGSIITVVGCGGDRDRTKRPRMARIVQDMSKYCVFTSDNPRTESLDQIFDDMRSGLDMKTNYIFIPDRKKAIGRAIEHSKPGDTILIAGKGHETYQEIDGVKNHFDDREVVEELFSKIK